jgi:hypothetical protein
MQEVILYLQRQMCALESVADGNAASADRTVAIAGKYLREALSAYGGKMAVNCGIPLVNFDREVAAAACVCMPEFQNKTKEESNENTKESPAASARDTNSGPAEAQPKKPRASSAVSKGTVSKGTAARRNTKKSAK